MFTCDVTKDHFFAHKILLAVNYCLFAHSGVSHMFNGKNDNFVLE